MEKKKFPYLGFGLGFRPTHFSDIIEHKPDVDWFEVISENYMDTGGPQRRVLDQLNERYPFVMHGVSLSIGTVDPINSEYLDKLKKLADDVKPKWISDHLCWTGIAHKNTHDLLPVPYTEEALKHIIERIKQSFHQAPPRTTRFTAGEKPSSIIRLRDASANLRFAAQYLATAHLRAACGGYRTGSSPRQDEDVVAGARYPRRHQRCAWS